MQEPNEKSFLNQVKVAFSLTVGITAILYVIGFLVINSFFISHGVVLYNLLSPQYLAAGIGFTFFYVITAIILAVLPNRKSPSEEWSKMVSARDEKLKEQESKKYLEYPKEFRRAFRYFFQKFFVAGYFIGYFCRFLFFNGIYTIILLIPLFLILYISKSKLQLFCSPYFYLWTLVVVIGFSLILDFTKKIEKRKWNLLLLVLILLPLSTMLYGQHVYPQISSSLGGGIPLEVQFIVDSANSDLMSTTLNLKPGSNITPAVGLLFETSDSFIVVVQRDQAEQIVQFKKELVKGIIYQTTK